jgi:hypothetical protein
MLDVNQVSRENLMEHTRTITRWKRHAGTPEELEAARYMEAELARMGYTTRMILHDAYISVPGEATLQVTEPQSKKIECITHSFALSTPAEGLAGELVYAEQGSAGELAAAGAAGKIALVDGRVSFSLADNATRSNVKGLFCIGGAHPHQLGVSAIWGSPSESNVGQLPKVSVVSVLDSNGVTLKELCRQGRVQVRFTAQVKTGWTKTPIVVADLAPGHPEADRDRYILFSGHVCSWFYGAYDNGTTNAAQLELARLVAIKRASMRRGLRIAIWSGHSQGRYSSSAWYADNFWFELEEKCFLHLNMDLMGARGATYFTSNSMPETAGLGARAIREVAGADFHPKRVGRDSDQSFSGIGIPTLFGYIALQPDGTYGWWWHTPEDTVDKVDPDNHVRDTRIFALVMGRLLSDPVLPLDYAASAADIRSNLEELAEASKGKFDLSPTLTLASKLETLCTQLPKATRPPREINACLQDLGRILIPATYTAAGRFVPDPAAPVPFLPKLQGVRRLAGLDPDSDQAKFLAVDLVRARNELVYALHRACARVEALLVA